MWQGACFLPPSPPPSFPCRFLPAVQGHPLPLPASCQAALKGTATQTSPTQPLGACPAGSLSPIPGSRRTQLHIFAQGASHLHWPLQWEQVRGVTWEKAEELWSRLHVTPIPLYPCRSRMATWEGLGTRSHRPILDQEWPPVGSVTLGHLCDL